MSLRRKIYEVIEVADKDDRDSLIYDRFMLVCIAASIVPLCFKETNALFIWLDRATVTVFIVDYLLRDVLQLAAMLIAALDHSGENRTESSSDVYCRALRGDLMGSELEALYDKVKNQDVGGGTDMYTAAMRGIEMLKE